MLVSSSTSQTATAPLTPVAVQISIDELSDETIRRVEMRMFPGQWSDSGFLADGESLVSVIRHDEELLAAMGVSAKQIADRLEQIVQRGKERLSELDPGEYEQQRPVDAATGKVLGDVIVEGHLAVGGLAWMSSDLQRCPFENNDGRLCQGHLERGPCRASQNFWIHDLLTGAAISFPGLAVHLIRDHCFFEGDVLFRVDPQVAARAVGLHHA